MKDALSSDPAVAPARPRRSEQAHIVAKSQNKQMNLGLPEGGGLVPAHGSMRQAFCLTPEIREKIDDLRGPDGRIRKVGIGRLAKVLGRSKAFAEAVRGQYAEEQEEVAEGDHAAKADDTGLFHTTGATLSLRVEQLRKHRLNPRLERDSDPGIEALAEDIRKAGQLIPILVVADLESPGSYLVVDGSRRVAAIREINRDPHMAVRIDAVELEEAKQSILEAIATIAKGQKLFCDYENACILRDAGDHGQRQTDIAKRLGVSPSTITQKLGPVRLPPEIINRIEDLSKIKYPVAYRVLKIASHDQETVSSVLAALPERVDAKILFDAIIARTDRMVKQPRDRLPVPVAACRDQARELEASIGDGAPDHAQVAAMLELTRAIARLR